jgi:bile acid:Na+ symporter, BASS family
VLVTLLLQLFIITLMLSVGFQLTVQDILGTIRKSDLVASSLFLNFLIIPVVALLLIWCLALPEATAITLLLASTSPGAPFAPKLVAIADGDLASAIGLTFFLSILAVAVAPLMAGLAPFGGDKVFINILPIIWSLVFLQMFPLLAGVAIRYQSVLLATRLLYPVKLVSDITFVALLILVVNKNFDRLSSVSYPSLVAMILFVVVTLVSSWGLNGSETRLRKALALTTAARNLALMLIVAVESFPGTGVEVSVIAFGLVELVLTLLAAIYFRWSC